MPTRSLLTPQNIRKFHKEPDFSNYCVVLFCDAQRDRTLRAQAGLTLKNHILFEFSSMTQQNIDYIKAHVPRNISDADKPIRNTTGAVISSLIRNITLFRWPEVLPIIMECLSKPDLASVEVEFSQPPFLIICYFLGRFIRL